MARNSDDEEFLTVADCCRILRVPRSTFYKWLATGKGPRSIRIPNGERRISRREWLKWLEGQEAD
ncbi:helix-turn-helix transcriptional regulator [Acrocarpospora macrocephala]|uniref:helix-turn-helix transcriptional regulator n=1 Tax=Acrocarpospora macrocephala TaxID=150177 RepID=UPI0012D337E1|nr:helix-turn-helix domain-containing protein [Acrocarpospora macrocephala]